MGGGSGASGGSTNAAGGGLSAAAAGAGSTPAARPERPLLREPDMPNAPFWPGMTVDAARCRFVDATMKMLPCVTADNVPPRKVRGQVH